MITIGDPTRWWNRTLWHWKLPVRKIAIVLALIFCAFTVWELCGQATLNLAWDLRHNRTASFRGQSIQLPWFWRADEIERDDIITFRHNGFGLPLHGSFTMIFYEHGVPESVPLAIRNAHDLSIRLQKDGWSSGDDSIDLRFACIDRTQNGRKVLQINCYSLDGQWSITTTMIDEADRQEFEQIVHEFAAIGTPTK